MTTDITELAPAMKAAAEKATPGEWRYLKTTPFMDAEISAANNTRVVNLLAGDVTEANSAFIALANPANVLALVEALEKARQRIDEPENDEVRQRLANAEHQLYMAELAKHNLKASRKAQFRKRRAAEKRIAELESRSVNIKFAPIPVEELGNVRDGKKHPYMFGAGYNSTVIHCESVIQQELDAKGIKWEAE